jgi:hypothetical protein
MTQATKSKPRVSARPAKPAAGAYKPINAPSPDADIQHFRDRIQGLQQAPMTEDQANGVLAKNGVPPPTPMSGQIPAKPPAAETWGDAFRAVMRIPRRGLELIGAALIAVAAPLLTAAVDGLGVLVVAVTVWEGWRPATALADAFMAWCGSTF